ncbi:MAG: hypothetical protein COU83_02485 [Candidatus Portnoybacteria bacterium CG10_big_fil_rev_8_21_14_0_10_40_22]|uniref:Uncharacterized protein n=2 Tax=Candidatus Portnoyibacteriota TaxID=1817913 RepID=A0A2M8KFJ5_9BACT|nr:MAG: hypothetical protein COU83_02485 [Candidatus Portnoybacteria bacterium CG10_big_fil_rev_8_21_14_0_10_40_22]
MKVKKVLSTVVFLSMVFLLMNGLAFKALPQNIDLISYSINDAFRILWENRQQAKDNSVTADVVISNLTGTWFQVELEFNQSQHNVVVGEDKIPYVFLMGPYQKKTFKNIEFFDMQVLQFDARRDVERAPAAFAMLSIDMICRGIFSTDFSPEQFRDLLFNTSIEGFEVAGDALKNDTAASLIACIAAIAAGETEEAVQSFAKFVFSLKESKKQIWQFIKAIWGEKDSILNTANTARVLGDIINLIEVPEKLNLMTILADVTFSAPTDDQFWLTAKSNIPKLPQVKIASPLRFTPNKSTYYVDDVITADFGLDNDGSKAIALRQVLVGGRGPGGEQDVQDFSPKTDVFLGLGTCYQYQGTLKLTKPGKYLFFCIYQTQDGQWNSGIDLGLGLNDSDGVKNITVVSNAVVPDNRISWEFNTPRNFDGWSVEGASDRAVDFEGHLVINPDRDPRVSSPFVSIDSRLYNAVMFRMVSYADNQQGQIYFNRGTGDYNEIDTAYFTVYTTQRNRMPEWRDYLIYLGDKPGWTGTIKGIRIDPASNGNFDNPYDDIAIDWIRLVKSTDLVEDSLVQTTGNDRAYLFQKGRLWPFSNSQMFEALGYRWSDIAFYSTEVLNKYALGPTIIAEGSLIKKNGDDNVYLIENGRMRWIASLSIFQQKGFKDDDIYVVPYQGCFIISGS